MSRLQEQLDMIDLLEMFKPSNASKEEKELKSFLTTHRQQNKVMICRTPNFLSSINREDLKKNE